MKFVDQVKITVESGSGGTGCVNFRREKFAPMGGPDGGNGGQGGSVIFKADSKLNTLLDLKLKKKFKAKNGAPGLPKKKSGTNGNNLILRVPIGTIVTADGEIIADLKSNYEEVIVAKGGLGGLGNYNFATSVNRAPVYAQSGKPGIKKVIQLELKLIAEVGLIGLPNAGKSTLLKTLTNANPKIGNYPFTTLTPNLGVLKLNFKEILIADIPGLIQGASEGVGLGNEFLRHVDRTKLLIHLISLDEDTPKSVLENYKIISTELSKSNINLDKKKAIVLLSKEDLKDVEFKNEVIKLFNSININTLPISSFTQNGIIKLNNLILEKTNESNHN